MFEGLWVTLFVKTPITHIYMEWTSSIFSAISLGIIAVCAIALVAIFWQRRNTTFTNIERVITWITFILSVIILVLLTAHVVPERNNKIEFSLLTSVMAILVTVLVGWQVWQAVVAREEIREISNRVAREENRVSRLQTIIEQTNANVETFTENARVLNFASCDISFSMVRELESSTNNMSRLDALRCFNDSYIMSARAVAAILRLGRDEEIYIALAGLAIGIMDRSSRRLFVDDNRPFITTIFSEQDHNLCETHFINIRANISSLDEDNFNRIMDCHARRIAFRPSSTPA